MKVNVPARTVDACDRCGRRGDGIFLKKCLVCDIEYCVLCGGSVISSVVSPDVCAACADIPFIEDICGRYATQILDLIKQRDAEILARCKG